MVKDVYDYVDEIQKFYPYIRKEEIIKVFSYGCFVFDHLMRYKTPIILGPSQSRVLFKNRISENAPKEMQHRISHASRTRYLLNKNTFDGVYYFGLTEERYQKDKACISKTWTNTPRNLRKVILYKSREECLNQGSFKHFFSILYPIDLGWTAYCDVLPMVDVKKIAVRDDDGNLNLL